MTTNVAQRSSWRGLRDDLGSLSRTQALLRGAIVGCAAVAALIVVAVGETSIVALAVLPVLGGLAAVNPHTTAPGLLIVFVAAVWVVGVDDRLHPLTPVLALILTVAHLCATLAATVPPQSELPRELWVAYRVRLAMVAALVVVSAALAWLLPPGAGGGITLAPVAALVVVAGFLIAYRAAARPTGVRRPWAAGQPHREAPRPQR